MADVQTMWSLAVVFFAIHLKLCGSHFSLDADAWLRFSALPGRESKTIAAQAVAESRSRVLIVAMRFVGVHATWAFALYLGYIFERENSVSSGIALAAVLFSYPMLVTVANEMVQLTAFWHMMIHHFMHFALAVVYIATAQQGGSEDWALDGIMVGSRFLVSAVSVRSRLAFPWQIVMSASLIALRPTPAWLMRELFLAVFTTFACAILEFLLLSRLEILLESVDTELMLSSCSRLLRGVCDGDILLDNQMQIHMPSQCLQRLLLSNSSYQGRALEEQVGILFIVGYGLPSLVHLKKSCSGWTVEDGVEHQHASQWPATLVLRISPTHLLEIGQMVFSKEMWTSSGLPRQF